MIVEDGTGISNADSYISLEDAEAYVSSSFFTGDWSELTNSQKESLLKTSSMYLDSFYSWYGEKSVQTSGLRWPRVGVEDSDDIEVPSNSIPNKIKWATVEMSIYLASTNLLEESDSRGVDSVKIDVIEITFNSSEKNVKLPNTVTHLLKDYGSPRISSKIGRLTDA